MALREWLWSDSGCDVPDRRVLAEGEACGAVVNSETDGALPVTILLADLARSIVVSVVPDQAELVERIPARWTSDPSSAGSAGDWSGGSVDADLTPMVISEVVYPLLTGTFAQVLGTGALIGLRRRRARRRGGDEPPAQVQLNLDTELSDRLRSACVEHGGVLGLTTAEATMLADALHGVLQQAITDSQRRP